MHISKLQVKNFKRFTDLTIDLSAVTPPPKLVLLIGANGSGKSSVFDVFNLLLTRSVQSSLERIDMSYYRKAQNQFLEIEVLLSNGVELYIKNKETEATIPPRKFYGRTSLRQLPRLTRKQLGQRAINYEHDSDRPYTFIDRDERFENDIEKITELILSDVFNGNRQTSEIKDKYVAPINDAFRRIFGEEESISLQLISLKPPLEGRVAEILFKKGDSTLPYDYLSSGEKEVFNVLLNLLSRSSYFTDTIYFYDEIDLHLNTQLQYELLKEITENWIPDNCQFWTASHSLGFIDYANDSEQAVIIDFDNLNFDLPQTLFPKEKNRFDVFEIAVSQEFLSKIFEGKTIVFSENTDTPFYNNLNIKDTIFFIGNDKKDVFYKAVNSGYTGLIDRDFLTDEERTNLLAAYPRLKILDYYSIENYFYHPDNLEEYFQKAGKPFNKEQYIQDLITLKNEVREDVVLGLTKARDTYPFYRENSKAQQLKQFKSNAPAVLAMLRSDDLETFYKVFPAKDFGTQLPQRQNLRKEELAKTEWFKAKIESILKE